MSTVTSRAPLVPLNPDVKLIDFRVPFPEKIIDTFSLATANQQEITQHKIMLAIQHYKQHESDTGSAIVQLAVMTEKIYNLARHFAMHKKDKAGQRGFQVSTSVIRVRTSVETFRAIIKTMDSFY